MMQLHGLTGGVGSITDKIVLVVGFHSLKFADFRKKLLDKRGSGLVGGLVSGLFFGLSGGLVLGLD